MSVTGAFEYDTEMRIMVRLEATRRADDAASDWVDSDGTVHLGGVTLHVPMVPALTKYVMGLGQHGRLREGLQIPLWRWQAGTGAHMVWLGDVHAGLRLKLAGSSKAWDSPMHRVSNIEMKELAWHNAGSGGAAVDADGRVRVWTGQMVLRPGAPIDLVFELLLTPCQPLQPRLAQHWRER